MVGEKLIRFHKVAVKDALTSTISSSHFVIEEPINDASLEVMFYRMHKNDSNVANTKSK